MGTQSISKERPALSLTSRRWRCLSLLRGIGNQAACSCSSMVNSCEWCKPIRLEGSASRLSRESRVGFAVTIWLFSSSSKTPEGTRINRVAKRSCVCSRAWFCLALIATKRVIQSAASSNRMVANRFCVLLALIESCVGKRILSLPKPKLKTTGKSGIRCHA